MKAMTVNRAERRKAARKASIASRAAALRLAVYDTFDTWLENFSKAGNDDQAPADATIQAGQARPVSFANETEGFLCIVREFEGDCIDVLTAAKPRKLRRELLSAARVVVQELREGCGESHLEAAA